jgi:abortive infection bacteriophage resistance protein
MISNIEVALRAKLVEALLFHQDALILEDSSIFRDKKNYWKNMATISSEIARSKDVFILHNFNRHESKVPVWAAVEVLSFGTLSKIIKNLKTGPNSSYSLLSENYKYLSDKGNWANPSQRMLTSWIHAVSVLRNMCAHNSRLYNRTIHTTPEILFIDKPDKPSLHNGLYQILLAMKYLRPSDKEWIIFVDELSELLKRNEDVVNLKSINFPVDWKEHLSV